jgi:hypothetical protein
MVKDHQEWLGDWKIVVTNEPHGCDYNTNNDDHYRMKTNVATNHSNNSNESNNNCSHPKEEKDKEPSRYQT